MIVSHDISGICSDSAINKFIVIWIGRDEVETIIGGDEFCKWTVNDALNNDISN